MRIDRCTIIGILEDVDLRISSVIVGIHLFPSPDFG